MTFNITTPGDEYGFWLAKANGTEARQFRRIHLPKTLPEPFAEKPVKFWDMDEGENHPGYRVFDTRKIDWSHYNFGPMAIGLITPTDLAWMDGLYRNERQVMISWKSGLNMLALFQPNGFVPANYGNNQRAFHRAELLFHLLGETTNSFTLHVPEES